MTIMHIFKNTNEKFSEPFIDFINSNFEGFENNFIIMGKDNRINKIQRDNVTFVKNKISLNLLIGLYTADKIILHALMSPILVVLLFIQPWLLKKCFWVIWGSDLYYYKFKSNKFRSNIYEWVRGFVIKRMGGFITHIKGDYELAKSWYGTKGKYYYSFIYPSNLFKELDVSKVNSIDNSIYIQVGNSADPSNNTVEVLQSLYTYKDEEIKIICPLSYGNINYKDKVIKEGKRLFGDKFIPLTAFLPFKEYLELLSKIDIAIFNHRRQQAIGNITTLLSLRKKVYIREDITTWGFCKDHGLKVFNANGNFDDIFDPMLKKDQELNYKILKEQFSKDKLIRDWEKIFSA